MGKETVVNLGVVFSRRQAHDECVHLLLKVRESNAKTESDLRLGGFVEAAVEHGALPRPDFGLGIQLKALVTF